MAKQKKWQQGKKIRNYKKLQGIISILFFTIKEQWINKQKNI